MRKNEISMQRLGRRTFENCVHSPCFISDIMFQAYLEIGLFNIDDAAAGYGKLLDFESEYSNKGTVLSWTSRIRTKVVILTCTLCFRLRSWIKLSRLLLLDHRRRSGISIA